MLPKWRRHCDVTSRCTSSIPSIQILNVVCVRLSASECWGGGHPRDRRGVPAGEPGLPAGSVGLTQQTAAAAQPEHTRTGSVCVLFNRPCWDAFNFSILMCNVCQVKQKGNFPPGMDNKVVLYCHVSS